jgi:nitrate/TMAO reductase-like tetraheme cytochrome c subunit
MKKRVLVIGTLIAAIVVVAIVLGVIMLFSTGSPAPTTAAASKCAQCHGDRDRLAELSEQPDKYYVDPAQFAQEAHGGLACTKCHGGDPTQDTPQEACLNGKANKSPAATAMVAQTCGSCHSEITARNLKSIHTSLDGIHLSLVDLLGQKDGDFKFQSTCNACHTTCASCHMEEPDRRNILWPRVTSHHFEAKSNSTACAACHDGMASTFFGTTTAPKHAPSLMAQAGMQCVDCHGDKDVHGTGTKTQFSMQSPKPTCQECHSQPAPRVTSAKDTLVAPQYSLDTPAHAMHTESALSCEACHTQWYPSCWNCHDGKVDKQVESLYLAVSPLTNKISPAAHSPAVSGAGGPIPTTMGGGWAIKTRHSWGASQTCEACHTTPAVYVGGPERQAPFVGYWTAQRANAHFVDEQLAQTLIIDPAQLKQSAHKNQTCDDCHQSLTDAPCAQCHTQTTKSGKTVLPAEGDWSRTSYMNVKTNLDQMSDRITKAQASGINVADWQKQWNGLHTNYLQASNEFHSNPGQTLAQVNKIGSDSQVLLGNMRQTMQARQLQDQLTPVGWLVGTGMLGALALGLVVSHRQK